MSVVYILSNTVIPNVCKVGMTIVSADDRAHDISTGTGVIGRWEVYSEYPTDNPKRDEREAHTMLSEYGGGHGGTEVFSCTPERAQQAVSTIAGLRSNQDAERTRIAEELAIAEHEEVLREERERLAALKYKAAQSQAIYDQAVHDTNNNWPTLVRQLKVKAGAYLDKVAELEAVVPPKGGLLSMLTSSKREGLLRDLQEKIDVQNELWADTVIEYKDLEKKIEQTKAWITAQDAALREQRKDEFEQSQKKKSDHIETLEENFNQGKYDLMYAVGNAYGQNPDWEGYVCGENMQEDLGADYSDIMIAKDKDANNLMVVRINPWWGDECELKGVEYLVELMPYVPQAECFTDFDKYDFLTDVPGIPSMVKLVADHPDDCIEWFRQVGAAYADLSNAPFEEKFEYCGSEGWMKEDDLLRYIADEFGGEWLGSEVTFGAGDTEVIVAYIDENYAYCSGRFVEIEECENKTPINELLEWLEDVSGELNDAMNMIDDSEEYRELAYA